MPAFEQTKSKKQNWWQFFTRSTGFLAASVTTGAVATVAAFYSAPVWALALLTGSSAITLNAFLINEFQNVKKAAPVLEKEILQKAATLKKATKKEYAPENELGKFNITDKIALAGMGSSTISILTAFAAASITIAKSTQQSSEDYSEAVTTLAVIAGTTNLLGFTLLNILGNRTVKLIAKQHELQSLIDQSKLVKSEKKLTKLNEQLTKTQLLPQVSEKSEKIEAELRKRSGSSTSNTSLENTDSVVVAPTVSSNVDKKELRPT